MAQNRPKMEDYCYGILGIQSHATKEEIETAYAKQMALYDPTLQITEFGKKEVRKTQEHITEAYKTALSLCNRLEIKEEKNAPLDLRYINITLEYLKKSSLEKELAEKLDTFLITLKTTTFPAWNTRLKSSDQSQKDKTAMEIAETITKLQNFHTQLMAQNKSNNATESLELTCKLLTNLVSHLSKFSTAKPALTNETPRSPSIEIIDDESDKNKKQSPPNPSMRR